MKMKLLLSAALLLGLQAAHATDAENAIKRGAAKAFYCTDCHGYNGMGTITTPAIAGDDANELTKKLVDAKARRSSIKGAVLAKFSKTDLEELSAYFASLKKTNHGTASFARDILPIIGARCLSCHEQEGEGANRSGLKLHTYQAVMAGTQQGGNLIIPGEPKTSTFMIMLTRQDHMRMPFGQPPLSDDEIRVIGKWIEQGAENN